MVNSFYHLAGRTSLPFGSYHFSAYNGKKKLNWTVFLALFAVFSSDERTLKMLDSMEVFQEGVAKEM